MVVFDTETLLYILDPALSPPLNPKTKQPRDTCKRLVIDALVNDLQSNHQKIIGTDTRSSRN